MIDKELVIAKLSDLTGYYKELNVLLAAETADILADGVRLHAAERLFQLIVDTAVDINTHMISETDLPVPDDYQSTFITLGENKFLPMELALKIAPSVGLRNLIVHKYGRVDMKKMIDHIKGGISDYLLYAKAIKAGLSI